MSLLGSGSLFVCALSLAGCSSNEAVTGSSAGGSGGVAAGGTSGGSGQSGTGGGAGASGASGGESDAAAADESDAADSEDSGFAAKAGFIGVTSRATEVATVFVSSVNADFFDGPGNSFAKGCARVVAGACAFVLCDLSNGGNVAPPTGAVQSAGTLTVGGTTPMFSLEYDAATMQYVTVPTVPNDKLLFAGGDIITFAAAGADVPAFTDTIVAPSPLVVTSPALPSRPFSIDTSKDLVFAWAGSSVGKISFNVFTTTSNGGTAVSSSFVSCQFDASALTGTIPAALLQKLAKTDAATTGRFGIDLSNTKEVVAGDHMVHLAVGSVATKADGKTPYAADQVTVF
jgi:hypothetical protein